MAETLRKHYLSVWLFALYFVYPIPHTIAVRNLLLIVGLAACVFLIVRDGSARAAWQALRLFRVSGAILLTLSLWLLVQSSFISPYPGEALNHLRGDWVNELLVALTGACAVLAGRRAGVRRVLTVITVALSAHIVLLLAYQICLWIGSGSYPFGQTPFGQKDYHSTLVTALIALLLADLSSRLITDRTVLAMSWRLKLLLLLLSLITTATLMARNAVVITAVMMLLTTGIFLFFGRYRLGAWTKPLIAALLIVASIAVTWIGLRSDERWAGFNEAASVAFDTQNNLAWLDPEKYGLPRMKSGQPVEESAYLRLAWAKVAIEQIQRYPLGLGYGHKAFGWAVNRSYQVHTGIESSHSGLLDFTLANGIPGVLLWIALSAALIVSGWRAFRDQQSPMGLLLVFTVLAYFVRCIVDGHLSGFRLEMYALLLGALLMAQSLALSTSSNASHTD